MTKNPISAVVMNIVDIMKHIIYTISHPNNRFEPFSSDEGCHIFISEILENNTIKNKNMSITKIFCSGHGVFSISDLSISASVPTTFQLAGDVLEIRGEIPQTTWWPSWNGGLKNTSKLWEVPDDSSLNLSCIEISDNVNVVISDVCYQDKLSVSSSNKSQIDLGDGQVKNLWLRSSDDSIINAPYIKCDSACFKAIGHGKIHSGKIMNSAIIEAKDNSQILAIVKKGISLTKTESLNSLIKLNKCQ
jgi:hypothetical protein